MWKEIVPAIVVETFSNLQVSSTGIQSPLSSIFAHVGLFSSDLPNLERQKIPRVLT